MTDLALVPHVPDKQGSVLVWLGVRSGQAPNVVRWKLDGAAVVPSVARALAPIAGLVAPGRLAIYTGMFEIDAPHRPHPRVLEVEVDGQVIRRPIRTLPPSIPSEGDETFNILLSSCFHRAEDKRGRAGQVLRDARPRPHLSVFSGDQVYLDLPTFKDFPKDQTALLRRFADDYAANWFGADANEEVPASGFATMLSLAPNLFLPDDHEFWNNYPEPTPPVENSWSQGGRAAWEGAAKALYAAFQQSPVHGGGEPRVVDIAPLSILLLDTRSSRSAGQRSADGDLLGHDGRTALRRWIDRLLNSRSGPDPLFGMLVTGQPLLRDAAGRVSGALADFEMADYPADYAFLVGEVERAAAGGLSLLLATGDVHWGRVVEARLDPGHARIIELISSPTSLVTYSGIDSFKRGWSRLKSVFGSRDLSPRHAQAEDPPAVLRGQTGRFVLSTSRLNAPGNPEAKIRGNQAMLIQLRRSGSNMLVRVRFLAIGDGDQVATESDRIVDLKIKLAG